jgi:hypothetical protein
MFGLRGAVWALRRPPVTALLLSALTGALLAQAPALQPEYGTDAQGRHMLRLRNVSSQPLQAWAVTVKAQSEDVLKTKTASHDAVLGGAVLEPNIEISPNMEVMKCGAIYADGSTAGDPESVESLLATRRSVLHGIPDVIALLEANADDPAKARQLLKDREHQLLRTVGAARAEGIALSYVKEGATPADIQKALAHLRLVQSKLQSSKPPLQ